MVGIHSVTIYCMPTGSQSIVLGSEKNTPKFLLLWNLFLWATQVNKLPNVIALQKLLMFIECLLCARQSNKYISVLTLLIFTEIL